MRIRELAVQGEVWCMFTGDSVGVSWDERHMPVAPASALAEWLRRERCEVCGRAGGSGCVIVSRVEVYEVPPIGDDYPTVDLFTGPACVDEL